MSHRGRGNQSSISFGGEDPSRYSQAQSQQQVNHRVHGGSGTQKNMGGYGSYDVDKPSSRVLAPPGGGSSDIFGTGPVGQPQSVRGRQQQQSQRQQSQRQPQQQQQAQPSVQSHNTREMVHGGKSSQTNMGGYGTYDVDKPSSRVLAPPGGGSSFSLGGNYGDSAPQARTSAPRSHANHRANQSNISFGGPEPVPRGRQQPQQQQQRSQMQGRRSSGGAGGSSSQANMGGYGSYDINKPSSRVLAPPGGGSSITFG